MPETTFAGIVNPVAIDFVERNRDAIERAVAQRMRQVGVPEEWIGMRGVPGVAEGAFTRYPSPQVGGNIRPDHPNVVAGRWKAGINVDEAIFDPTFRAFEGRGERCIASPDAVREYQEMWASVSTRTRVDAAIAHEYEELRAIAALELQQRYGVGWPHYIAVANAPESALRISDDARELLRLHRRVMGLE